MGGHLVHVVAELALRDGPGLLVVPLEGRDLGPHDGRLPAAVVVHAPVVHARQEVCSTQTAHMHYFSGQCVPEGLAPHIIQDVLGRAGPGN